MAIKKKEFDLKKLQEKFSTKTQYKEDKYFSCGEEFLNACGLPGPSINGVTTFLGHSNTSKTTAMIIAASNAQKKGILPVFVITEKKWQWEHAKLLGLECERGDDGVWNGLFLFNDNFDYIEQATDYVNSLLDAQERGEIPYGLAFFWDSIGSVPCKMTFEGKGGKMHNAAVLADKVGMGLTSRVTKSKKMDYPYDNSITFVNQPWVELPSNPFEQPKIKAKGGEAIFLNSSLVFLFGNQKNSGVSYLTATKDKRKVTFATRTKVSILKNHMNGLGYQDGKIIATPHGYIPDTADAIEEYKNKYSEYWKNILGTSDFNLREESEEESVEILDEK